MWLVCVCVCVFWVVCLFLGVLWWAVVCVWCVLGCAVGVLWCLGVCWCAVVCSAGLGFALCALGVLGVFWYAVVCLGVCFPLLRHGAADTVAILAQGTNWAVADTQAFFSYCLELGQGRRAGHQSFARSFCWCGPNSLRHSFKYLCSLSSLNFADGHTVSNAPDLF